MLNLIMRAISSVFNRKKKTEIQNSTINSQHENAGYLLPIDFTYYEPDDEIPKKVDKFSMGVPADYLLEKPR